MANQPIDEFMSVPETKIIPREEPAPSGAAVAPHTLMDESVLKKTLSSDTGTPNLSEYRAAAETAYHLTTADGKANADFQPFDGFTVVKRSDEFKLADGFSAVALKDRNGHIIAAFEGTQFNLNGYNGRSIGQDLVIANNSQGQALKDAVQFTKEVQEETGEKVFLGGHFLGAIEAQAAGKAFYDDKSLKSQLGGGVLFGGTGLPGNTEAGPASLVTVVNTGDPVGSDSSDHQRDVLRTPSNNIASDQDHFGKVAETGSASEKVHWDKMNASQNDLFQALLTPSLGSIPETLAHAVSGGRSFYAAEDQNHGMKHYDAHINEVPESAPSYPFICDDTSKFVSQFGVKLKEAGVVASVSAHTGGEVVAPDASAMVMSIKTRNLG